MKLNQSLGAAERQLLQHIAESGPSSVRSVFETFGATHNWGRTTVLKTMERLRSKGFLVREEVDGLWHYRSVTDREELDAGLIGHFVKESLGGSLSPFVQFLKGQEQINAEDKEELMRLVRQWEEDSRGGTK